MGGKISKAAREIYFEKTKNIPLQSNKLHIMRFEHFQYQRPDLDLFRQEFEAQLQAMNDAGSAEAQSQCIIAIDELRDAFSSQYNICHIRHTIDTKDSFYEQENNFFDENMPHYDALNNRFYRALLDSPFRAELEQRWGSQLFAIANMSLKTFDPIVLEDLQEENRLSSEYTKLKAAAQISFRGETHNLSSIYVYEVDSDRQTRREASTAKWSFFSENDEAIGNLFDQLVKVRHRIATKLGYRNFVELGYARMLRADYNADMVTRYRDQVRQYIVPIAGRLYERQRRRLGLDQLAHYDEEVRFLSGNPRPHGNSEWIIDQAAGMYAELSPETGDFFSYMRDNHLMDLLTRPNKAPGGYCTFIGKYKAPYIYSNFNGTSADIDVLTHEAGHAFQVYSSRDAQISEYHWPTFEACEIHSMSMEFFTWPWMDRFFESEADKHRFVHLNNALCFLPYGVAVDEFQHRVYENPDATPDDRKKMWRDIEKKYLPHRRYEDNHFLENGGFWYKQSHIFNVPFYYIDYCLAQICAFQFWKRDREDHKAAWGDYVSLCQAGGSGSFLQLVELAHLRSPFDGGCVASVVDPIEAWLESVDDSAM